MKTSEKIVIGEYLLIAGFGVLAICKGGLMLCDRVTKLEKQQENLNEALRILKTCSFRTKERIDHINEAIKHS